MSECYLHTVTWFQKSPDYLRSLPPEQVKAEISAYVKAIVRKYNGKVNVYNIVNEAFYTYGGGDVLMQKLGEDYITFLFDEAAKEANAGDMLIYNDYNVLSGAGSKAGERIQQIKEILQNLNGSTVIKDSKVIIGLGIQSHLLSYDNPTKEQLAEVIDQFGVPVIISEADVILSDNVLIDRLQTQAEVYKLLMDGVLISKNCKSVYIFGTDDAASFFERELSLPYFSSKADPLLFDDDFMKKASYYGLLQSLFENLLKR
jgi:endo-1,4-beta-xylanase